MAATSRQAANPMQARPLSFICRSTGGTHSMAVSNYAPLFTGAAPAENTQTTERSINTAYRILLVDDEPNVLKALQRVFRQEHYEVLTASGGQEALELLRKEPRSEERR